MTRRIGVAILVCAVMVLVAAVPLAMAAEPHPVVKGPQGPRASAVTWSYTPTEVGVWTGFIVNNGLRSLVVDVYDDTTGGMVQISHQRIRFAAYNANPTGEVTTNGVLMAGGRIYSITVTPNGPRGSTCTVEDRYEVPVPPVAVMTVVPNFLSVTVNGSGSYDPNPGGSVVSYAWDFGDLGTATGVEATHTYAAEGLYTITLTVTDNDGLTNSATQSYLALAPIPPIARFTAAVNGLVVSVDGIASSDADGTIVSYVWDFGDTGTATGVSATHTYAASGTYTITLTVTDSEGLTNWTSQAVPVTGGGEPTASFTATANRLNVSVNASASSDPDGTIVSYDWNFGDGAVATGVTASHLYATWGTWWITLTVTDSSGKTGSTISEVTVSAPTSPPPTPYTVTGYAYDSVGGLVFGASVTITDVRTGAVWLTSTDFVYGYYIMDLNTNESGWAMGDTIQVTATLGGLTGSASGIAGDVGNEAFLFLNIIVATPV